MWGAVLNKAVGFAQSSRKSKWAQSKRPGGRGLTGHIVSQKCPTDCLRLCANTRGFLFYVCGGCMCAFPSNVCLAFADWEIHSSVSPFSVSPQSYKFFHPLFKNLSPISRLFVWLFHGRSDFMTVSIRRRGRIEVLSSLHSSNCTMWWPWKSNGYSHRAAKMKPNSRWLGECSHISC